MKRGRVTIPTINTKLYSVPRIIALKMKKYPSATTLETILSTDGRTDDDDDDDDDKAIT